MTDASTYLAHAWAARRARAPLAPLDIPRRAPTPRDVRIEILYCGIWETCWRSAATATRRGVCARRWTVSLRTLRSDSGDKLP